jgi:transaldolase
MSENRLHRLHALGQSIWLDFIERTMLRNGELARLIREDAVTGMTSNPTIFEKALSEGTAYDDQIRSTGGNLTAMDLFEVIATTDVRDACDAYRNVYDSTSGYDGFVSIEVSPEAANDARSTISEAQRLWATVDRPNLFVKVPGTEEGATAVRQLIAEHHAALFARGVRARHRCVHEWARGSGGSRQGHLHSPLGRQLLRQSRR